MRAALRLAPAILAAALSNGAALAQGLPTALPGLAPAEKAAAPPAPQPPAAPDATLEKRLADARADLERVVGEGTTVVPAGVPKDKVVERRALAERMVRAYEGLLDNERTLVETQRRRAELDARNRAWTGFPTPPPYSILMVDELRGALAAATDRVQAAESKLKLMRTQADIERERLARAQAAARQAAERLEGVPEAQRAATAWERDLAERRARLSAIALTVNDAVQRLSAEQAGEARDEVAFLERQLRIASADIAFSRADLDRVLARLAAERSALEREAVQARATDQARRKALDAVRAELEAARRTPAKPGDETAHEARIAHLERLQDLRRVQAENADISYDLIRALIDLTGFGISTWEGRFAVANTADPARKRATYENVTGLLSRVQPWREYVANELEVVRGRIGRAENQLALAAAPEDAATVRELLAAWREREAVYVRVQSALERQRTTLERWKDEFDGTLGVRPWWSYAIDAAYAGLGLARSAWDFELFTAEDSLEIDGRKVTARRSVTVGKSVGAIVLLVLGYIVVSWLVRRLERAMVARLKADPAVARITRRWLQVMLVAVLFVLALDIVKIPLTVFAFLGGALAIGFGFGAQNLLKNLMSGVMLLVERPLKVGDIVEIGGIVGTVTNISIRASTIRAANGIETLVPNSTLIESNVTNWTLSNPRVRRDVRLGVAYGSDTRKVSDTLLSVAERHGQVLKDPAPRVIFEDFGADALAFTLEFWVDYAKGADSRQIASDLRFMAEKALADAGIGIPFPQRDVHLDASRPLQVEVVGQVAAQTPRGVARG
jgi:small-conductance mechanosensitive channel